MAKLVRNETRHKERCEMYGCKEVARHAIGKSAKSTYYKMRLCDECLLELRRIANEVFVPEIPENSTPPEASTDEEMNNNPSDEIMIEDENDQNPIEIPVNHMKLVKVAKTLGMDATNSTKDEEIHAWLHEKGLM